MLHCFHIYLPSCNFTITHLSLNKIRVLKVITVYHVGNLISKELATQAEVNAQAHAQAQTQAHEQV